MSAARKWTLADLREGRVDPEEFLRGRYVLRPFRVRDVKVKQGEKR